MSLAIDSKKAIDLGFRRAAIYEDGTKPASPVRPPAIPPPPDDDAEVVKALQVLSKAISAQGESAALQREALIAVLKSNDDLARAVIDKINEPMVIKEAEPKSTVEEWSFEHTYQYGDLIATTAKRIK